MVGGGGGGVYIQFVLRVHSFFHFETSFLDPITIKIKEYIYIYIYIYI